MNIFQAVGIAAGMAATAAAFVSLAITKLKNFDALRDAVLAWVTNPASAEATLQQQYIMIRNPLFGQGVFTRRRWILIAFIFVAIWSVEAVSLLVYAALDTPLRSNFSILLMSIPAAHLVFVTLFPISSMFLVLISFLMVHGAFYIFDAITMRSRAFGNRLDVYLLLVLFSYFVVYCIAAFLSAVVFTIVSSSPGSLTEHLWGIAEAPLVLPSSMWELWQTSRNPAAESDGLFAGVILAGILGTMLLSGSAMCVASLLNLIYAMALGVSRLDYLLRVRLRWNHGELYRDPVGYLAAVASVMTGVLVFVGGTIALLFQF